jgi:hypothetical protein
LTPKAPLVMNSTIPMTAGRMRPWIMQPMATRAIQTERDPEHEGEEQESEHEVLRGCGRRSHSASSLDNRSLVGNPLPGHRGR